MTHPIRSIPHQKVSNPRRQEFNSILKNLIAFYRQAEIANAMVALQKGATYADLARAQHISVQALSNKYKKASALTPALSGKETYAVSNPSK